jgi:5-formyltetrahydrofolate cyclo-ligase
MKGGPRIPRAPGAPPAPEANPKAALRKVLLCTRAGLDSGMRARWDSAIGTHILRWRAASGLGRLGVYWPLPGEPDLRAAYAELAVQGVRLALPVVLEKDAPLAFAAWLPGEAMVKDAMGVSVPKQLRIMACPPALLVPCLGFNDTRLRLGYGGGFYDRTLAVPPRPATLGVAYACLAAQFAGGAHDIALDSIVTEDGII